MSFKGLRKTIVRAPQSFRQKLNMGQQTVDPVYQDAERRFKELEDETKKLSDESKRYFAAVNGMLDHQIEFSKAIEEIYNPISGKVSDPTTIKIEGSPEGIEAAKSYREVVAELKATLKPDLELIESRIIAPLQELLKVILAIRKMATKRNHKQLDLDRHLNSLKKVEEKKEKTPKDEEKLYKVQADVEIAQQEYDYYNDMLKQELPVLFQLEAEFIKPLFVSLYYMQLNIFYTLYNRMEELKIPYFDLTSDIVEAFQYKRGDIEEQADAIGITHFKIGHARAKLEATKRRLGSPGALPVYGTLGAPGAAPAYGAQAGAAPAYGAAAPAYTGYSQPNSPSAFTPPTSGYGTTPQGYPDEKAQYGAPAAATGGYGSPAPAYTSPPATATPPGVETCTALYDYTAQAAGDLTFTAGTVIEIVQRTLDTNGWWTGRINGAQGVFPGNYVQLN